MRQYPAVTHISWREWLALLGMLGVPFGLLALGIYLLIRAVAVWPRA